MASDVKSDNFTIADANKTSMLPSPFEGNALNSEKDLAIKANMHPKNSQVASVSPDCSDSSNSNNNNSNIVENQVISSNSCPSDSKSNFIITMPSPAVSQIPSATEEIQFEISNGSIMDQNSHSVNIDSTTVGICLVCGDFGSGYHYSAFSCEGCKGFFKRTVQKNLSYRCKETSNCVINKFTRNSCQHCRFERCLQVGMKREAVREDRTPGGKHRHKRRRIEEFSNSSDGPIRCVASDQTTDSLLEGLVNAAPDRVPKTEEILGGSTMVLNNITGNELLQCSYLELKYIIDWAKKVPGFQELNVVDQTSLLKSSFMELSVLRLSYRSMGLENVIKFANGLLVPTNFDTNVGLGNELINASLEFCLRLRSIQLDHSEFCILNALVLTYPDASGVQDKQKVANMQTQILDSLRRYVAQKFPNDLQRYGKMLLRLPALRTLSAKAAERFMSLTLDGCSQLNELVTQMIS